MLENRFDFRIEEREEEQEQKTRDDGSMQLFFLIVFSLSRTVEME